MTVMNSELYRALREVNVSEDAATKAAESVAAYRPSGAWSEDQRLASMDVTLTRMDGRLNTLNWMVGATFTLTVALGIGAIWQLIVLSSQLGRLTEAVSRIAP